jgi:hypothetical protein
VISAFARCTSITLALLASFLCAQAQNNELRSAPVKAGSTPVLEPRQFAAIAHDSIHRQSLLFGGTYGSQRLGDTWLLTSSGWAVQTPKTHPTARISSAAAYDSLHSQYILFGGRVQQAKPAACSPGGAPQHLKNEYFCGDTWVFTGGNWVQKSLALSPSPREGHAMVFDAARNQVVLFGGTSGSTSTPLNDTWIWNGTVWKQIIPGHSPPARLWHSMAYDPVHRQVVLFGGDGGTHFLNDTWLWNGTDWQAAPPQATPPALRTSGALDYDPTTGKMILFSGSVWTTKRNGSPALDSWSWDGSQWKQLAATKFQLISDFSKLTPAQAAAATLANSTPSLLWLPVK